ncbi:MAG: arsenic transporter [Micrococcales bacterium]|nr:arsenic transporter [Micrococcales bacterium]
MRTAIVGAVLLALGAIAIGTGVLPADAALAVGARTWPILLFVVAITIVTELAAEAGLFRVIASRLQRIGRGRALVLWLLVVGLAVISTIFLSLDTTAVLLTPVVVLLVRGVGLPPLPFALTTVWIANTGSLLLPVSNLTNLLAERALGSSDPARFAGLMALPAAVAIVIPCAAILVVFRRDLALRFAPTAPDHAEDPLLFWVSAGSVAALLPLLVSGIEVWIPASAAAVVLVVATLLRSPRRVRLGLVPWQLVVFASGLFLVVEAAQSLGLEALVRAAAGSGESPLALLRLAGASAAGANVVDNLPAYLAFEPVAGSSPQRIAALLIGVNAGPLITPWASLATLLWHSRLRALGVEFSWRRYLLLGTVVAPITVAAATFALSLGA